jgi:cytochrome-b5 reductase
MISRPYTPVSSDSDLGYFDLLIKIYEKGQMGQYLDKLPVGSTVDVKGPTGEIKYKGNGLFEIGRRNEETKEKKVQVNLDHHHWHRHHRQ